MSFAINGNYRNDLALDNGPPTLGLCALALGSKIIGKHASGDRTRSYQQPAVPHAARVEYVGRGEASSTHKPCDDKDDVITRIIPGGDCDCQAERFVFVSQW